MKGKILTTLPEKLRKDSCALLVIDVQNDFCAPAGWYDKNNDLSEIQKTVPRINALLEAARANNVLTVLIKTVYSEEVISDVMRERLLARGLDTLYCVENSWGGEFYIIEPQKKDIIVVKQRHSAFFATELDMILHNRAIKTIIPTGVATNVCVDCTLREGFMRGYYIVLPEDCSATFSQELHRLTVENTAKVFGAVCTAADIMKIWAEEHN